MTDRPGRRREAAPASTAAGSLLTLALASVVLAMFAGRALGAPAMGEARARVLLNRTGFGATHEEILRFAHLSVEAAVERLLDETGRAPVTPPPAWSARFDSPRRLSREERRSWRRTQAQHGIALRAWWLTQMRNTPSPLTERMILFWHSHFASSLRKVHSATLMYRQHELFRRHALGSFGDLLHAIARDPAMLLFLDGRSNRKGSPNENFAREVMELFTLGEGHYTETDVSEAARAFTGMGIHPATGEARARPLRHDAGRKQVLGHAGRLDADDVMDLLLAHPRTAVQLVSKLWREFVSPDPDEIRVSSIADKLRASGYDVKVALRELLSDPAMYQPGNRGSLIKSPVELVVGSLRMFQVHAPDMLPFAVLTMHLGQALFAPPGVKGWAGGETWIDASSLLARKRFMQRLLALAQRPQGARMAASTSARSADMDTAGRHGKGDPRAILRRRIRAAAARIRVERNSWLLRADADPDRIQLVLLAVDPVSPPAPHIRGLERVRALTRDPVFQLK